MGCLHATRHHLTSFVRMTTLSGKKHSSWNKPIKRSSSGPQVMSQKDPLRGFPPPFFAFLDGSIKSSRFSIVLILTRPRLVPSPFTSCKSQPSSSLLWLSRARAFNSCQNGRCLHMTPIEKKSKRSLGTRVSPVRLKRAHTILDG